MVKKGKKKKKSHRHRSSKRNAALRHTIASTIFDTLNRVSNDRLSLRRSAGLRENKKFYSKIGRGLLRWACALVSWGYEGIGGVGGWGGVDEDIKNAQLRRRAWLD